MTKIPNSKPVSSGTMALSPVSVIGYWNLEFGAWDLEFSSLLLLLQTTSGTRL